MVDEPAESLWVRVKEKTHRGDIVVGVYYRLPDQEEQGDEALYTAGRSILSFAGPCPHGGLKPTLYLLEGQHSRA